MRGLRESTLVFRLQWREILSVAFHKFWRDRIPTSAAAATFYALLALFPAIACFVSLYGLFADVHEAHEHLIYLRGLLPHRGLELIGRAMLRIAATHTTKLSVAFVVSLAVSFWSASAGVSSVMEGLNAAYEEREQRGYIQTTLLSLAFTLAMLVLAMGLFTFAALPVFSRTMPDSVSDILEVVRWIVLLGLVTGCLLALYCYGPSGTRRSWSGIVPGTLVAVVIWLAASALFSVYVSDFANYDQTYGSLGAVIGFLVWIWISLLVVLFGGELNAQVERRLMPQARARR